jgi:integrase
VNSGAIYRAVRGACVEAEALHPYAVVRILKERAKAAGLEKTLVERLSGHSMRVGAAQDMAAAGIELGAIMHAGGWKSPDMVMRYIEHLDAQKSGMARMYNIGPKL